MPREDSRPPPNPEAATPSAPPAPRASPVPVASAGTPSPTTPSQLLLERLVALADRAIEAAREGDMAAVSALLDEREPFLTQLAGALAQRPGTGPASSNAAPDPDDPSPASAEAELAVLARRDLDAMALLERGIAEARLDVADELDAITAAQATVSRYAHDSPLDPPAGSIDIRR